MRIIGKDGTRSVDRETVPWARAPVSPSAAADAREDIRARHDRVRDHGLALVAPTASGPSIARPSDPTARIRARLDALEDRGFRFPHTLIFYRALQRFDAGERVLFETALDMLEPLLRGEMTAAAWMTTLLRQAAAESGGDNARFVRLLDLVFSEPHLPPARGSAYVLFGREVFASTPADGALIDRLYEQVVAQRGGTTRAEGFVAEVLDSNPMSTVTHHFSGFVLCGFHRGAAIAAFAAREIDDATTNPGDVRNAYFASMLGAGLAEGLLTPEVAAELTIRAYTDASMPFPWSLAAADYDLARWLRVLTA